MSKKIWTKEETSLFKQIFHLYTGPELAEIFNCEPKQINAKAVTEKIAKKKKKEIFPEGTKRCSSCREILELDFFNKNKCSKDGKSNVCKSCSKRIKSLSHFNTKHRKITEEEEKKKQAYIDKWKDKVIVCKHHGEQTLDDYRLYKNSNGNYSRKCKLCEAEQIKKARDKKQKEQGYV